MDFRILGPLEVVADNGPISISAPKLRSLLLRLLLDRSETVSTDRLIDAVWAGQPPATAPKLLQQLVSQLRRSLGESSIETRPGGYAVRAGVDEVDAARFERMFAEGQEALAAGNPQLAAAVFRRALSLWRGSALADVAYEAFAEPEAARLEELRLSCLEERFAAELALGADDLAAELAAAAEEHPLRERLRSQLMLAYYRAGRQADALDAYATFRATMNADLGLEPGEELRGLQRAILRHDPELAASPSLVAESSTMPSPTTQLIGRDRDVATIVALVQRSEVRLVTMAGAGGTGKTRLAIAAAQECRDAFANGVVFVELGAIHDPELVLPAIASACGVEATDGKLDRRLGSWLETRELLLVLDNVEQVVAAGDRLSMLLTAAPRLTLLTTSRVVLHLAGEHVFPVQPLAEEHAVALFVARAQARDPSFQLGPENDDDVREICSRLDHLPLAIELAAAKTRTLDCASLRRRLDARLSVLTGGPRDLPARQQTLRQTLLWSTQLLEQHDREAFGRLAVFAGGWSLEAAETICGTDPDVLATLIDHNLVFSDRHGDQLRFRMLETVHEHAAELLAVSPDADEWHRRHADHYYATLLEDADFKGATRAEAFAAIDAELDNLRTAVDWCERSGDDTRALRLATGLYRYFYIRGHIREAQQRLRAPLERGAGDPVLRAHAFRALAGMTYLLGDLDAAERQALEGIETGEAAHALEPVMGCHTVLGLSYQARRRWTEARQHIFRSRELSVALGLETDTIVADSNLGAIALEAGDLDEARMRWESALAACRRLGIENATSIYGLGLVAIEQGRINDAAAHFTAALEAAKREGFKQLEADICIGQAAVEAARGDIEAATVLFARGDALLATVGSERALAEERLFQRVKHTITDTLSNEPHDLSAARSSWS